MEKTKFGLGVFVCIFNKNFSKILLVKRNKEKREKIGLDWGNIGGRIELGEYSIDACIREAREEICVNLDREKLKLIDIVENPNNDIFKEWHVLHFVYAAVLDENTKFCLNEESEEIKWFDLNKIPDKTIDRRDSLKKWASLAMEKLE